MITMQKSILLLLLLVAGISLYTACQREPVPALPGTSVPVDPGTTPHDTIIITETDTIYINQGGGPHTCSPDTVYFEQDLLPILQSNCASPNCHDNISHKEGIWMTSYEFILTTAGVSLTNPANSKLYKVTSPTSGDRMPPSPQSPLTAAQRALLLKWIQQGAQDLHCDAACDPSVFSFNAAIKPILAQRCTGCHSGSAPSGGINYSTYAGVKSTVDNGKLWGSITHAAGFIAMPYPQGSAKISDCDLAKIKNWIDAGAPDN